MTDMAAADRRRVPRVEIADTELSVLEFPIQVRLLDISLGGVLLESTQAVDLGQRGTLRFKISTPSSHGGKSSVASNASIFAGSSKNKLASTSVAGAP